MKYILPGDIHVIRPVATPCPKAGNGKNHASWPADGRRRNRANDFVATGGPKPPARYVGTCKPRLSINLFVAAAMVPTILLLAPGSSQRQTATPQVAIQLAATLYQLLPWLKLKLQRSR